MPIEVIGTASALVDALTLGALLDRYEALRTREGKRIRTLPEAMRLLRRSLGPYLSLPAGEFSKADLRAARDAMVEADAVFAGNRMLGLSRSGDALGGTGGPDPDQLRRRTSAVRPSGSAAAC